jgi:Fe-S-cluster-containing dehydrogenase component
MSDTKKYGMLIDYEYCTGCKTCEIACRQEYQRPAEKLEGVQVHEFKHTLSNGRLYITNMPFFTKACIFCAGRVKQGLEPACAQHCMANVLKFGEIDELQGQLPEKRKAIIWTKG